jgi:MoaE-MoaD fusion protein
MRTQVLFFGILKELTGKADLSLDVREAATVRDVLEQCAAEFPRIKEMLPTLAVAVNQQYAAADKKLNPNDEIALLPPVSGGSGNSADCSHRCFIVRDPIDTQSVLAGLKSGEDGATVVFEGVVRNQTRGRKTLYLDYEAYEEMALQRMESLVEQALQQFQIREVAMIHRLGRLEIGEISILVVVASAHRAAAFDACRWLIDTLKRTVPIWKKEYFEDGAVWANGEAFPAEIPRANSPG